MTFFPLGLTLPNHGLYTMVTRKFIDDVSESTFHLKFLCRNVVYCFPFNFLSVIIYLPYIFHLYYEHYFVDDLLSGQHWCV